MKHPVPDKDIICPFCGEDDFDKIGLKYHLLVHCESFEDTLSVEEERAMRRIKEENIK